VDIGPVVQLAVRPEAAGAAGRVLTELLDNALRFSPPQRRVSVSAHVTADGAVLVRVQDAGLGFEAPRIELINFVLAGPPASLVDWQAHQTGFAVAHREAHRHGLQIRLHLAPAPTGTADGTAGGTVATMLLPAAVVCEVPATPDPGPPPGCTPGNDGQTPALRPNLAGGWPTAETTRPARPDTRPDTWQATLQDTRSGTGRPPTASVPVPASAGPAGPLPVGTTSVDAGQLPPLPTRRPVAPDTSGPSPAGDSRPAGEGRPVAASGDRLSLAARQHALVAGLTDWPTAPPVPAPTTSPAAPSSSASSSASSDGRPAPEGRRR
jgi:hypothetical protein